MDGAAMPEAAINENKRIGRDKKIGLSDGDLWVRPIRDAIVAKHFPDSSFGAGVS